MTATAGLAEQDRGAPDDHFGAAVLAGLGFFFALTGLTVGVADGLSLSGLAVDVVALAVLVSDCMLSPRMPRALAVLVSAVGVCLAAAGMTIVLGGAARSHAHETAQERRENTALLSLAVAAEQTIHHRDGRYTTSLLDLETLQPQLAAAVKHAGGPPVTVEIGPGTGVARITINGGTDTAQAATLTPPTQGRERRGRRSSLATRVEHA